MVNNKPLCCGCSACVSVCPKEALKMGNDKYGFFKPTLNPELCVHCGLCEKVCPMDALHWKNENAPLTAYACANKKDSVRSESSSGGVFYELAKQTIEAGGVVVGCVWASATVAAHAVADTLEGVRDMMKSKYVQSSLNGMFQAVRTYLKQGRRVLFSGTPCQVAGLRNYIGKTGENLLTVDFICHGVPSQKTLRLYVAGIEQKKHKKVSSLNFRTKVNGWSERDLTLAIGYADGTAEYERAGANSYYHAFLSNLGLSAACVECRYNCLHRASDLTLGDFWGIDIQNPSFQDQKGTSCVVINTAKGDEAFRSIGDAFVQKQVSINDIRKKNPFINGHAKKHPRSERFLREVEQCGDFDALVEQLLKPTKIELLAEISNYQFSKFSKKVHNFMFVYQSHFEKKKRQRELAVKNFSIISNNCWGSAVYQKYGLRYGSPTAGLYILGHDFVKLCSDWQAYMKMELKFIPWEEAKYHDALRDKKPYPVARLGDIEVYFMHYASEEEAAEKWNRRAKRIDPDHLLFKLSQREECSKADIEAFMALPLKNKICFAYDEVPGTIHVPELKGFVGDEFPIVQQYLDELPILNRL